ncbi:MAG: transposase [Candidatus Competibacteraceae bacterium]|nr:transposase [Candidatus Competibacteraceae bacterium]MCB1813580.1 transposase [Candidatus Competibacteraceae bacterium]
MSQKRQYKSYSAEFKEEAVELVTGQGYRVAEAAASPRALIGLIAEFEKPHLG